MAQHPSLLRLARLADGSSPEAASLREHVAECAQCQAALASLEADVSRYSRVEARQRERVVIAASRYTLRLTMTVAAVLVVAGLVAYWQWPVTLPIAEGNIATVRAKGSFVSEVVLHRGDAPAERLSPGSAVTGGDLLAAEATATSAGHVAAFAVDERGAVTHLGSSPRSTPIGPGAPMLVPGSYRLDDAPTTEFIVVCFGSAPFTLASALDALEAAERPLTAAAIEAAILGSVAVEVNIHTLPRAGR